MMHKDPPIQRLRRATLKEEIDRVLHNRFQRQLIAIFKHYFPGVPLPTGELEYGISGGDIGIRVNNGEYVSSFYIIRSLPKSEEIERDWEEDE